MVSHMILHMVWCILEFRSIIYCTLIGSHMWSLIWSHILTCISLSTSPYIVIMYCIICYSHIWFDGIWFAVYDLSTVRYMIWRYMIWNNDHMWYHIWFAWNPDSVHVCIWSHIWPHIWFADHIWFELKSYMVWTSIYDLRHMTDFKSHMVSYIFKLHDHIPPTYDHMWTVYDLKSMSIYDLKSVYDDHIWFGRHMIPYMVTISLEMKATPMWCHSKVNSEY